VKFDTERDTIVLVNIACRLFVY